MKKYIPRAISALLLAVLALTALTSCGGANYRDDVAVSTIDSAIQAKVPVPDGYYAPDSDYLTFYFEGAEAIVNEYVIQMSATSTNINQFGIFHVKDGEAENMKKLCENYIAKSKDRWVAQANYIASEHPKMEGAEVRIFGNYVVYTMLTDTDKALAFEAVEAALK
ncbi:MAG: DUF4358 domain-containing protein [Clostridia bacterium]|nr:DUF4358 domain-containing protein [Clostridia bacterium]